MNPFTNPKKRDVALPKGAKDLADVIHSAKPRTSQTKSSDPTKRLRTWIESLLLRSRERHATELVIEPEPKFETASNVTERIEGTWHRVMTVPADLRSTMVSELIRMAAFTGDKFPGVGLIGLECKGKRLMWRIDMERPGSQCVLTPLCEPGAEESL